MSARCSAKPGGARPPRSVAAGAPRIGSLSCEQTGRPRRGSKRDHVPAEVSELLVDTLESHGGCVGGVVWGRVREVVVCGRASGGCREL